MKSISKLKGYSFIEVIIILGIIGIIASIAISSYSNSISTTHLKNTANQIYSDLKLAKSEALKQNKTIFVSFSGNNTNWCYGVNEDSPCNCNEKNSCQLYDVEKVVSSDELNNIQLQKAKFAGGGTSTAFDPNRGFAIGNGVRNGSIWLKANNDNQVAIIINRMGRVRYCSPQLAGYSKSCPTPP